MSYSVKFISGREVFGSTELIQSWRQLVSKSTNPRIVLQTPEWAKYRSGFAGELTVGIIQSEQREIIGLVPLLTTKYSLNFIRGIRANIPGAVIMGNEPLAISPEPIDYSKLFEELAEKTAIRAIHLQGVLQSTKFSHFLDGMDRTRNSNWFAYSPESPSVYYFIDMPSSFSEYYEERFDSNMRHNRRRETKRLRDMGAGDLALSRIDREEQVSEFLNAAAFIAKQSWQKMLVGCPIGVEAPREEVLGRLAKQGWLRAYLLKCRDEPCAYAIAYQCNGIFYYYEIAHDPKWLKGSPGKVILYLLLEDLFTYNRPKLFYFGPGMFDYKRWFANGHGEERTIHIMRKTISNSVIAAAHQTSRSLVLGLRNLRQLTS